MLYITETQKLDTVLQTKTVVVKHLAIGTSVLNSLCLRHGCLVPVRSMLYVQDLSFVGSEHRLFSCRNTIGWCGRLEAT